MLNLTRSEIESLLEAIAPAVADLSAGRMSMPTWIAALVPERDGLLAAMPAYLPSARALTTKLVSLFPDAAAATFVLKLARERHIGREISL